MELLTTAEVAQYLRLKERKVYDLVRQNAIPCARVTGKLVFPRQAIDRWIMSHLEGDQAEANESLPVYAGSSDPLLAWALNEAHTDLAQLCNGSADGVARLLDGRAQLIGLHIIDPQTGVFNDPGFCGLGGMRDLVIVHWAKRTQGLVLPAANPHGIEQLADIAQPGLRIANRPPGAGARTLFTHLLEREGIDPYLLERNTLIAHDEDAVAIEISNGQADVGLAIEAVARRHNLAFQPLITEPLDLAMKRRTFFQPAIQRLINLSRTARFHDYAAALGGYNLQDCSAVQFNA